MQADRIGYFNSYIIFNVIASLSSFFVWTFAKNYGPLLVYAVLFGFGSGSYYVLMPPIFTTILPADQFHSGLSLAFMTNCIPIFGVNISSVIQEKVDASPFFTHIMFTGVSYLLGAILLFGLKLRFNKHILSKI
jgi:MFS family permease